MPSQVINNATLALENAYQSLPWIPVSHWQPGDHYVDLVCDRLVRTNHRTPTVSWHGEIFFFCSHNCRRRFEAEPADYLPVDTHVFKSTYAGVHHATP